MNSVSFLGFLALLVASATAGVSPSKNDKQQRLVVTQGVTNCAIPGTATAVLLNGSVVPAEIPIPGAGQLFAEFQLKTDMPTDLQLALEITKLEPSPAVIPCFDGVIGSCQYDVCSLLANDELKICQLFPATLPCSCPLKAGTHTIKPVPLTVPDLGDLIGNLMLGNYEGKALLYSKANQANPVGCLAFTFKLIK